MNHPSYRLDIVIPTYNRPALLYRLIHTIFQMQLSGVRIVILDDASTVSEVVPGLGDASVKAVCESFGSDHIAYFRADTNRGIVALLTLYHRHFCAARYTLLMTDKDEFLDAAPIHHALSALDEDPALSMVLIPIVQKNRDGQERHLSCEYQKMSGATFIEKYVYDTNLQHAASFSIFRVSGIRAAGVPRLLNLRAYGLEDACGFDIDFLMMVAATGDVGFGTVPHVRHNVVGGFTEKYPLTFAYCYYQYAKRTMKELRLKGVVSKKTERDYLAWWNLLILRGLHAVRHPSDTREEKGTRRLSKHLKVNILIYCVWQCMRYQIWPTTEMKNLFENCVRIQGRLIKSRLIRRTQQVYSLRTLLINSLKALKHRLKQCVVYLSGRMALDNAPTIAINSGLPAAVNYLKTFYRFYRPAAVRFWMALYEYLIQLESENIEVSREPGALMVHFCCWGKDYTDKAKTYLLPSLNALNNLPLIARSRKVMLLIHCDKATQQAFVKSPVMKNISLTMEVKFCILPQALLDACKASYSYPNFSYFKRINAVNVNHKYFLLGGLQSHALKVAIQHRAFISFMMPDFLLSDSFFQQAFSQIKDKTMVCTTAFRTNFPSVKKKIDAFVAHSETQSLSIPAPVLTELQIEHMHPAAKRRVVSESTENFVPTPQLIFEGRYGFIVRAFHYHPVLVDCATIDHDIKVDYMPIDYILLNKVIKNDRPYAEQIWVCDHAGQMSMMELSGEDIETHFTCKEKLGYQELVKLMKQLIINAPHVYDTSLNHYFSSIKHKVIAEKVYFEEPSIDDDGFFAQLRSRD